MWDGRPKNKLKIGSCPLFLGNNDVKISAFPEGQYFGPNYFHNLIVNRENPQFSRHYDNNAVNIGQHRFAQILIMKIMLTDIHGIIIIMS